MTFVGKILVIVIMAFSLLFLALSTVVFTTSKNWMVATKKEQEEVDKLKKKVQDAQAASEAAKKGLEDAKVAFAADKTRLESTAREPQAEQNKRDLDRAHGGPKPASGRGPDGQEHAGRGRRQAAADRVAAHPIVGGREAGERVQTAPG